MGSATPLQPILGSSDSGMPLLGTSLVWSLALVSSSATFDSDCPSSWRRTDFQATRPFRSAAKAGGHGSFRMSSQEHSAGTLNRA